MRHLRLVTGVLSYRKRSTGFERGRELFTLTRNRDGSRTMRCLAMTDDSKFVRNVSHTLGADERPLEVYIHLQLDDAWVGSGYFRLVGSKLHLVTHGAESGHVVQSFDVDGPFHIISHAVMLDAWAPWSYDPEAGGEQVLPVYNTSTRWNGTDGPLGRLEAVKLTYQGEEEITVPAGTFQTRHYSFDSDFVDVPTSDIYVTGPDNLLVRYDWGGFDLEYVLASLEGDADDGENK